MRTLRVALAGVFVLAGVTAQAQQRLAGKSVPELTAALKDKDAKTRAQAAMELGRQGPKAAPAVPALIEALKDADVKVRNRAAEALGDIGAEAKTVVPVLADMLTKDPDLNVRCAAANALGDFKAEARSAIPALKEALKSKQPLVQDAAAGALKKINDASRKIGS